MDFSIWSVSTPGRWLVSTPGRKQYLDTEIPVASSVANLDFLQFVSTSKTKIHEIQARRHSQV